MMLFWFLTRSIRLGLPFALPPHQDTLGNARATRGLVIDQACGSPKLGFFLKEISAIVRASKPGGRSHKGSHTDKHPTTIPLMLNSQTCRPRRQNATLLRSQHLGLGRGEPVPPAPAASPSRRTAAWLTIFHWWVTRKALAGELDRCRWEQKSPFTLPLHKSPMRLMSGRRKVHAGLGLVASPRVVSTGRETGNPTLSLPPADIPQKPPAR